MNKEEIKTAIQLLNLYDVISDCELYVQQNNSKIDTPVIVKLQEARRNVVIAIQDITNNL